ncbi:RagB/SusD family nutrient uptake outer membrane protein [Olivibacter ginsenosidimutans]|uniref:RagB/SusD family nutrient uptake outer membrane protein n=1 Tax=Olivibacter ginsenosidimutans TaxID=1176537 RepID=A0ABP9ASI4_9SPHI
MKTKITYTLAILVLLVASCKKDLNTAPTDAVEDSELYKTADNIETVVTGAWAYLNDTYFTYANPGYTAIQRTADAMGSDVAVVTSKYGYPNAYKLSELYDPTAARAGYFWQMLYKVIDNCNNVITRVDASEGSEEKKAQVKGQAQALRAFCYLNLATYYQFSYLKDPDAPLVPVYTEPTTIETKGNPRSSVKDVYALIVNDLTSAATLLADYERPDKDKIDAQVVSGLLARTYLNMGEWAQAAQAAHQAREGYPFMPSANYADGFNDIQNVEWIWGHGQTSEQSTASYTFHFLDVSSPGSYYYSFMADPYFKTYFDDQDIRSKLFAWDGLEGREGLLRYQKFKFKSNLIGDIVYMRSAEMALIEAEAYARNGQTAQAVQALNALREARNAKAYSGAGGDALVEAILLERRKELWGEGFALGDILRTQGKVERKAYVDANGDPIMVTVTDSEGKTKKVAARGHSTLVLPNKQPFSANSTYYLFAIPETESQQNGNL